MGWMLAFSGPAFIGLGTWQLICVAQMRTRQHVHRPSLVALLVGGTTLLLIGALWTYIIWTWAYDIKGI